MYFHPNRLENADLPYNAYAFKLDRVAGNGMQDRCILYKARASVVNLASAVPGTTWDPVPTPIALDPSLVRVYKKKGEKVEGQEGGEAQEDTSESVAAPTADSCSNMEEIHSQTVEDNIVVVERPTEQSPVVNSEPQSVKHQHQSKKKNTSTSDDYDDDEAAEDAADTYLTAFSASSSSFAAAEELRVVRGMDPTVSVEVPEGAEIPSLCIELVGNRFLRRMVRILTVRSKRRGLVLMLT